MADKVKIGFTAGDVNGIGLEVILKALKNEEILNYIIPVIYGSAKVVSYHKNILANPIFQFNNLQNAERLHREKINVVNCWQDNVNITLGVASEEAGKCAYLALDRAVQDIKKGYIDTIVTAPINKATMQLAGFKYPGHTEYLADNFGGSPLMIMVSDVMRMALVSGHVPLQNVSELITKERVSNSIEKLNKSLRRDFGKEKPLIAVLGLNPHAGDQGVIGSEDDEIIRPAVIEAKKNGMLVMGPYSADGFFGSGEYKKFDAILAMYHDQGLIPFKLLSFQSGVNYTAGLNIIRTSPDHGTAYSLAGKNEADHHSMLKAIYTAVDIFRNRKQFAEDHENSLNK